MIHMPPHPFSEKYPVRFMSPRKVAPKSSSSRADRRSHRATRGMLGKKLVALPDGATVINIARGGLIDLGALKTEVSRGRLRCAIDVTDPLEPLP